jgi:hypothetical protein
MENNNPKEINYTTKIKEIKLDDFQIEKSLKHSSINIDGLQYEFNIGFNINIVHLEVFVELKISIFSDLEKRNKVGSSHSHGIFTLFNLSEILKQFDGKMPNVIIASYIGLLISTTRGFLIDRIDNTPLKGAIIPIINPITFFPKQ